MLSAAWCRFESHRQPLFLFDRPSSGERAVLVNLSLRGAAIAESLAEFRELSRAAGADVVAVVTGARAKPDPAHFIGSGKLDELRAAVAAHGAEVALFNHGLSPAQERNLERELKCRVVDRTGVILDIFARRARTYEGKLQVELAQLKHISTRLVRGWTHLERQKGGIGLRGPGETQLEVDRRLIDRRMRQIEDRLERVRRQRREQRRARSRADLPAVSLVGYTNAGKSTLFNALTGAEVYVADQLFATLDPTLRRLVLPGGSLVLSDTVGFIRHLPHDLVAAFRATLEEAVLSVLLLVVVDSADPQRDERAGDVARVLEEIGAEQVPRLVVLNQIDRLDGVEAHADHDGQGVPQRVWLSARSGAGLDLLRNAIAQRLWGRRAPRTLFLPAAAARLRARFYALGVVVGDHPRREGGWEMTVHLDGWHLQQLCRGEDIELPARETRVASLCGEQHAHTGS